MVSGQGKRAARSDFTDYPFYVADFTRAMFHEATKLAGPPDGRRIR